ncbi:hypothetical protein DFH29DRAFT_997556 [Suillus ampliporus]|nr:hypothetical protein DFH29DRAFT_997556 [Suillus ampliporus]
MQITDSSTLKPSYATALKTGNHSHQDQELQTQISHRGKSSHAQLVERIRKALTNIPKDNDNIEFNIKAIMQFKQGDPKIANIAIRDGITSNQLKLWPKKNRREPIRLPSQPDQIMELDVKEKQNLPTRTHPQPIQTPITANHPQWSQDFFSNLDFMAAANHDTSGWND